MFTLENLSKIEIITLLVQNTYFFHFLENSLKLGPSVLSKYKNCISTPFKWDFMRPKMCASIFFCKKTKIDLL